MRRRLAIVLSSVLLLGGLVHVSAGAQESTSDLRIESVDTADYPEVSFSVSVPAHADGPRPGSGFTITENGEPRQARMRYADTADLQVVLLIDTTGSMGGEPIVSARAAAQSFLEQLPDDARVAVMNYDSEATVITDFASERSEHAAGIDGLEAGGRTAMYDAVLVAAGVFPEAAEDTSRVIVLLTDGEDNESTSTVADAVTTLTDNDITLHSIEYQTAFTDDAAIRDMANATGGAVNEAADPQALTQVYQDLAAELVSRYTVQFASEASGEVTLGVTVDHDGLVANGTRTVTFPDPAPVDEEASGVETDAEAASEADGGIAAPSAAEPPSTATPTGSGRTALIVGAGLWFLALALIVTILLAPRRRRTQLEGTAARLDSSKRGIGELANRASHIAERTLERRGYRGGLNAALERAGINLRPGEFVVLVTSFALTAWVVGMLLHGWTIGLLLAFVTVAGARLAVSFKADRRQKRFADQLGETLQLLSGSLRAGYSMMQAVDAVAREAESPAAEEFGRLVMETRLGRDMADALHAMADRMQSDDFTWVMQAIEIHREVGGDLAEVLDTVAGTIRERNQIRRQVQALSAEGKLSAYILLALPFAVGLLLFFSNPSYLGELINGGLLGWTLITIGGLLMTAGVVWMRKLVKLVF
jgi:tight adherence protein B